MKKEIKIRVIIPKELKVDFESDKEAKSIMWALANFMNDVIGKKLKTKLDDEIYYNVSIIPCNRKSTDDIIIKHDGKKVSDFKIIQNAIRIVNVNTRESIILCSRFINDKKSYTFTDENNKKTIVYINGGLDKFDHNVMNYYPFNITADSNLYIEDLMLVDTMPMNEIKEKYVWGTTGPKGDQPLKFVKLVDCETIHLMNILKTVKFITPIMKDAIHAILAERGYETYATHKCNCGNC